MVRINVIVLPVRGTKRRRLCPLRNGDTEDGRRSGDLEYERRSGDLPKRRARSGERLREGEYVAGNLNICGLLDCEK